MYKGNKDRGQFSPPVALTLAYLCYCIASYGFSVPRHDDTWLIFYIFGGCFAWAGISLCIEALSGVVFCYKEYYRKRKTSKRYGAGAFASIKELRAAGWLSPKKGALFVGTIHNKPIFMRFQAGVLYLAPPGAGKTVKHVVPTILSNPAMSYIITDLKKEIYHMTHDYRRKCGKVILFDPFGGEGETMNPFWRAIKIYHQDGKPELLEDIVNSVILAIIKEPTHGGENQAFRDAGRNILIGIAMYLIITDPENATLSHMGSFIRSDGKMREMLEHMSTIPGDIGMRMLEFAEEFTSELKQVDKGNGGLFAGGRANARAALRRYSDTSIMGQFTSDTTFNPADLRKKGTTLYIVVPPEYKDVAADTMSLLITELIAILKKTKGGKPVTLCLDEMQNFGGLSTIVSDIATLRGCKVQFLMYVQSFKALIKLYGKEGAETIRECCDAVVNFQISDFQQAKDISDMVGHHTIQTENVSIDREKGAFNTSFSETGQAHIRPEALMAMHPDEQIVTSRGTGLKPIKCRALAFWQMIPQRFRAGDNPLEPRGLPRLNWFKAQWLLPFRIGTLQFPHIHLNLKSWLAHMIPPFPASWFAMLAIVAVLQMLQTAPYVNVYQEGRTCHYIGLPDVYSEHYSPAGECPSIRMIPFSASS